ncbi:MAG: hypothetical protein PVF58_19465 [Candidatus Methanofastidiosia archaeon]|jgi:hypothetical protein
MKEFNMVIALKGLTEMDRRELLLTLFGSKKFAEEVERSGIP